MKLIFALVALLIAIGVIHSVFHVTERTAILVIAIGALGLVVKVRRLQ